MNYPYAWLGVFALLLIGLGVLQRYTKLSFSLRVFVAMILGLGFGLALFGYSQNNAESAAQIRKWFSLVGYGYVDLLRMLIIPLVPTSIIVGLLKLNDTNELKSMGFRTIGLFLFTALLASLIGLLIAGLFGVGVGNALAVEGTKEPKEIGSIFAQFRDFIPRNPVQAAAETKLIPVVVFAIFVGVAAVIESGRNKERIEPFKKLMESLLTVVSRIVSLVIQLTPYGVLSLTSYWLSSSGISALADLSTFLLVIVIACAIQILAVYGGFLSLVAKVNPARFYRAAFPAMLLAFTSRSSAGTLTLTISTMIDRLKVQPRVANFIGPIGAVMNMDACGGIFPAAVAVFTANAYGIDLSLSQYVLIVVVSILASIGSAAVPMGATSFTIITLTTVGLPVEGVLLVAGIDFLVDMFRTATNVTGDLSASVIVGNSLGEFDREGFAQQDFAASKELA